MFQVSIFIKTILKGFIGVLFVFSICTVKAQPELSLIRLERERGWLISGGLDYTSSVGELIRMRVGVPSFMFGYIFNRNWSFITIVPFEYEHVFYSKVEGIQEEKTEELFKLGNIIIAPRYRFQRKGKWIEFPINIQIPTLTKISGNREYRDIEERERVFAIEPAVEISKVFDPIVSSVRFSFVQPLWRKKDKKKIYDLWQVKAEMQLYFLINEKFSYFSALGIHTGKKQEYLLFEHGISYRYKPNREWRLSLLNRFGDKVENVVNLSFTIMQGRQK